MHIIITGGSGFVGTKLSAALVGAGHTVTVVDLAPPRKPIADVTFVKADLMHDAVPAVFGECDAIIHLAGVSIFQRWTSAYKKLIIDSRVETAKAIHDYLAKLPKRPKVFVSASAVGYYGNRGEELLKEDSGPGSDFLANVCEAWEGAARTFADLDMRTVSVRTSIVIGPGGGMMAQVIPLFRYGIGGRMGSGKQWLSWIHIDDLVRVYTLAATNETLSGPVNASAPQAVPNKVFARTLGKVMNRPSFIPAPAFALRIVLGEFASAVLSSAHVIPNKLNENSFTFAYPDIESALRNSI